MKAIIETGGKQYYVSEGTVIYVEKLDGNEGDKVVFDKVLMANGVVGNPYVSSKVEGVILKQGKQKKLTIFRYKPIIYIRNIFIKFIYIFHKYSYY